MLTILIIHTNFKIYEEKKNRNQETNRINKQENQIYILTE